MIHAEKNKNLASGSRYVHALGPFSTLDPKDLNQSGNLELRGSYLSTSQQANEVIFVSTVSFAK